MDATPKGNAPKSASDVVILVHGTYAASTSDHGSSWWQRGSTAWNELAGKLPEGVRMAGEGEVFHWSGENGERARSKAGRQLLARMTELESQDRSYHLIGHSHGGSVIWHALRQATLQRQRLDSLRSWSTVGTPFLKHRSRSPWHMANVVNLVLAIMLLRPAIYALRKLSGLFGSAIFGQSQGILITDESAPALTRAVRGPLLHLLESLGVSVNTTAEGIHVGSFDPTSGDSFFEYLFLTPEGWLLLGITLLCVYVFANLATFFLSPLFESLRIRQEAHLERKVMASHEQRWLGIWSTDDEAINGLKKSLELTVSFVHRMTYREPVFFSDRLFLIARPYHWLLIPFYNKLIRPFLDSIIRSHVVKTALGNNRPTAEVIAVSTAPGPADELREFPPLPAWLNEKITTAADTHARDIAPQLRCLLAEPSFASGLETFSNTITGHELVHTSYFDHTEIMDLLATHIAWGQGGRQDIPANSPTEPSLDQWFGDFKTRLGTRITTTDGQTRLVQPRRAA